jgi:hypothetical protein
MPTYDDPVLAVADDLARRGVKSSAVREQVGYLSIEGARFLPSASTTSR